MRKLIAAAGAAAALWTIAGAAQAQMFIPDPHSYGAGSGRFTLAGARAGVTVLGVDLDASANLKIGLHDRYRGGGAPVYAPQWQPQPAPYAQPAYSGGGYGEAPYGGQPSYGYAAGGYGGGYAGGGYAYGGEGYAMGYAPAPQSYYPASPCGC